MRCFGIILAGGEGDRFGGDRPKQFLRLAGEPVLVRTLRCFAGTPIDQVVVVAPVGWIPETQALIAGKLLGFPVKVIAGGQTRNESTRNGFVSLDAQDDDVVLVHDGVRPLVPRDVIMRSLEPVISGHADATDTVIMSADTLVVVEDDVVVQIPDRRRYRRGQTPQVFRSGVLAAAYAAAARTADFGATDDCSLVLRYVPGVKVFAVAGDEVNVKITTRTDMVLADRIIQMRSLIPGHEPASVRPISGASLYIIGGTSGIGRAIGDAARQLGAEVLDDGTTLGLDVRDHAQVASRMEAAAESLGGLDHVICTAGVMQIGRLADMSPEALAEVVDVNLTGTLNVARAARPHLLQSKGSLTVFTSSSFTRGRAGYVAYSASKAAVANLAQGLAEEWADDRIRVNAVSPERTDTPMRRRAFPEEPSGSMLSAQEVARLTLGLIQSDLTGQVLDIRQFDALGQGAQADE